jgi:hypothetical protein
MADTQRALHSVDIAGHQMLQRKGGMFHDTLPRHPARDGPDVWQRIERRRIRASRTQPPTARNPHPDAGVIRAIAWTSNALLDGRIRASESLIADAKPAPQSGGLAAGADAFAIQALAIPFSLFGPVPINNRIINWTPQSLPDDWKQQEYRWDVYHWVRTFGLIVAFAALILSAMIR